MTFLNLYIPLFFLRTRPYSVRQLIADDFLMRRNNALAEDIAIERRRRAVVAEIQRAAEHNEQFNLNLEYKTGEAFEAYSEW